MEFTKMYLLLLIYSKYTLCFMALNRNYHMFTYAFMTFTCNSYV